jgi:hypothetical protein
MSSSYCIVRVNKVFESVEHKFPVPCHTYLVCDRDFGVLEWKAMETVAAYDPEFWHLFELAKLKNPFQGG